MNVLLEQIFDTERNIQLTSFFGEPSKICLLSFIGASEYFICENGLIWNRSKVYPNKYGILSKYYVPWVYRDQVYLHPWSLIKTSAGQMWFPVLQLLGWAFYLIKDPLKKYFLPAQQQLIPYRAQDCEWSELAPIQSPRSRYLSWIEHIYN